MRPVSAPRRSITRLVATVVPCPTCAISRGAMRVRLEQLGDAALDRFRRIVRRRGDLVKTDAAVLFVEQREVGERAADVDSDSIHRYSSLMPASCITLRHLVISEATRAVKSAGLLATTTSPWLANELAHLRRVERPRSLFLDFSHDVGRRAGGREETEPHQRLVSRVAGLGDRRHVGHDRVALQAAHAERAELSRLRVRQRSHDDVEHERDVPAQQIDHGGSRAFVGNVDQVHFRHRLEKLHRHVRGAAAAGGAVIERAGTRFRERDQILHRLHGDRRMDRKELRNVRDLRDRREIALRIVRAASGRASRPPRGSWAYPRAACNRRALIWPRIRCRRCLRRRADCRRSPAASTLRSNPARCCARADPWIRLRQTRRRCAPSSRDKRRQPTMRRRPRTNRQQSPPSWPSGASSGLRSGRNDRRLEPTTAPRGRKSLRSIVRERGLR